MEDESLSLINRIYYAARDGMAITIFALLSEKSYEYSNYLINKKVFQEDGQNCTPLIIAARCGHDSLVKMLLDKFDIALEREGSVKIDGQTVQGATALWCAAAAGHLNVVKTLVRAGADINHATTTNSTPVRAACYDGRLDIVKYLTDHNADIHITNKFNNTCLMIAAYKGHLDIVTFLLNKGMDPNAKEHCGSTALHHAAETGHLNVVLQFMKYGTKMTKNMYGMTPLTTAAESTWSDIVEFLVSREEITKEEVIEAYELLGASFANHKDNYCLANAYKYLHKSMTLRYSDPNNIIHKKLNDPVPAYENWVECKTLEELESIKNNSNALHMESLAIRERILGSQNPEVPQTIIYRGAVFADDANFDRCIDLWLHALKLGQGNNISVGRDLLRFAQVFSQMIHVGADLHISQVTNVLEVCIIELEKGKAKCQFPDPNDDIDQIIDKQELNITTTLYILTILTKVLKVNEKECNKQAHHLVRKLCALQMRLRDGQTLLHLAVNSETPVDDFHTNDVCKFPCAETAKLLIQCGADVDAMDNERNTPLHIIVKYQKPMSDFMTLHTILMSIITAGAHMDIVNKQGETPYKAATTGVAEIILRTQTNISLKCIAAKAVKTYKISYCGNVPRSLESFIELHGPDFKQG